jgi:hypothetical protein
MKEILIGTKKYLLMEDVGDINDKRFNYFKMYLLKSLEGIDRPLFKETLEKGTEFFNHQKYFQALGVFQNYAHSIESDGYNDDALSKCFALICLFKDEDQLKVDELYLNEKLEEMWKEGLTRKTVEESVQNFTIGSPASFGAYSLMMEEMSKTLSREFYEGLNTLQKNLVEQTTLKSDSK